MYNSVLTNNFDFALLLMNVLVLVLWNFENYALGEIIGGLIDLIVRKMFTITWCAMRGRRPPPSPCSRPTISPVSTSR